MGTLKVLPGVIDTSARDAPGWGSVGNMSINGQTSFNFSYDGVTNKDTGSNSGNYAAPALDSIAEVKVQASNFQAEYGRSSGATITVVTKSGYPELPRHRRLLQAARGAEYESLGSAPRLRRRARHRPDEQPELRKGPRTGSTTPPGRWAARSSSPDWTSTATATSCSSSSRRICCRAPIRARCSSARCRPRWNATVTSRRRSTARAGG